MPLFDFRCGGCDRTFEALVRGGAAPVCPACGSADVTRLLSTFAVSSSERRSATAAKQVAKAAKAGAAETRAREREAEAHRHEDH